MKLTVRDIAVGLEDEFPAQRAEDWDRVGLLVGDPEAPVTGVILALDPTAAVVRHAASVGANVVVTHHPAFLSAPTTIQPGPGPSGVVFDALTNGVALLNAHTNLDRDPRAQGLMPSLLGLTPVRPIERRPQPVGMVTVYGPPESVDSITEAMREAGAGRVGDYDGCRFVAEGVGSFTARAAAAPLIGRPGEAVSARESRIEMVCPRDRVDAVVAAAAVAHPYEEPLISATEVVIARNAAALGALSRVQEGGPSTLGDLAIQVAQEFGVVPRVWGDPAGAVSLVATATGSASSLIPSVVRAGADVLVAGEVRYHDALDAAQSGLGIIELGHDVSEWPLVGLLETAVRGVPGIDSVAVTALAPTAGWWNPDIREGA